MSESLFKGKLLAAQIMAIVGLHNLPENAFSLALARKEAKKPDPSREEKAKAKRLRKQMRNIRNIQNVQKHTS